MISKNCFVLSQEEVHIYLSKVGIQVDLINHEIFEVIFCFLSIESWVQKGCDLKQHTIALRSPVEKS